MMSESTDKMHRSRILSPSKSRRPTILRAPRLEATSANPTNPSTVPDAFDFTSNLSTQEEEGYNHNTLDEDALQEKELNEGRFNGIG